MGLQSMMMQKLAPSKLQHMQQQLVAMGEPSPEFLALVRQQHLDLRLIEARAGLMTVVPGRLVGDDPDRLTFRLDPDGVPVAAIEALTLAGNRLHTLDIVAWPLHGPEYFGTACGPDGGADLLGIINCQCRGNKPLAVHRTPLDWLRGGCDGVVPLNRQWAGHWLDRASGPFVAQDLAHGKELRALLGKHASKHQIFISNSIRKVAA